MDGAPSMRDMREERGWSRMMLAAHAKVSLLTVANIEDGKVKSPSYMTVTRLADALEVSDRDLSAAILYHWGRAEAERRYPSAP